LRARLGLSNHAQKDWARLEASMRTRVMRALEALASDPPPPNIDERALVGHEPWRRMRVGDYRVIFRPLTRSELAEFPESRGYLIERVISRGELERATKALR